MRILVTGGCGFIGSYFVNMIPEVIVNIDRMDYCADESRVTRPVPLLKIDICETERVRKVIHDYQIDTIVHFAAQTHVDNSFVRSMDFTRDNIVGTHSLLEASRGLVERFVHVSTDEVYGESHEVCYEDSALAPTNPYAASKAAAEMICFSYWKSFKFPLLICRMNNAYGPGQYPEKVIPKFLKAIKEGQPCTIQGDGKQTRAFVHVEDIVRGIDTVLRKGTLGEAYNIGTDHQISILDLAKMLGATAIEYVPDRPFNDCRYTISSDKLKALGWKLEKTMANLS